MCMMGCRVQLDVGCCSGDVCPKKGMKPGEQLLQEGEKWRTEDEEAAFPKEIASPNPLFAQSGCHPVPITFS